MDRLKEHFKIKKLEHENFWDTINILFKIFEFILWHMIVPALAGLGFLFYSTRNGNTAYLSSFFIAVALSNMVLSWNNNPYAREGTKICNRIIKRRKEISKIVKRLNNARRN